MLSIATMAENMKKTSCKRVCHLTRDTSNPLSHTCSGFIDLSCHLLSSGNKYIIIGWFSSDPIEKSFAKLRQWSSGTYLVTAKSVIEKVLIQHPNLLQLNINIEASRGVQSVSHPSKFLGAADPMGAPNSGNNIPGFFFLLFFPIKSFNLHKK